MSNLIYPRMSEKAFEQSSKQNVYTFNVPLSANKITIKRDIQDQFKVKVVGVNVSVVEGKTKRNIKKSGSKIIGKRSDYKKAYVNLAKGDSIPVFAAAQEGEK